MKLHKLLFLFLALFLTMLGCSDSNDVDGSNGGNSSDEIVLLPTSNLYGVIKDDAGNPIPGVVVSDGTNCVVTDESGLYQMRRALNFKFVYLSVPSEYEIPVDVNGYPNFYRQITEWPTLIRRNFTLKRLKAPETEFKILGIGDPQCQTTEHVARFNAETMADIRKTVAESTVPVYGIALGDIGYDRPALFPDLRKSLSVDNLPIFCVIGNHDKDNGASTSVPRISDNYENSFGPLNYSFNRGNVHFVGMDNVLFTNSSDYSAGFTDAQVEWLRQDLSFVPKDKMIVLFYHIPMRGSNTANWKAILAMLKEYKNVRLMCGHTHYNENYINSASNNSIHEHIHAAACGAWWFSDINGDGAPNGYGIHYFKGDNLVNSYYKPTHGVKEHQIRLHRGGDTAGGPYETFQYNINTSKNFTENTVLANIWNASSKWDVRVIEGDNDPVKMTLMSTVNDSWSIGYHIGVVGRGYIGGTRANYLTSCKHLYYYEPKNSSSSIKVIATDEFGNVYEQSTFTASRDYTEAKAP